MSRSPTAAALAGVALAAALSAGSAQAHHSVSAEFDLTKNIELEGVLQKVEWINPHSQIVLGVQTPEGLKSYQILTAGVASMRRSGAGNPELFKLGQLYKVTIHPARRGANRGVLEKITFPDGRTMAMSIN